MKHLVSSMDGIPAEVNKVKLRLIGDVLLAVSG